MVQHYKIYTEKTLEELRDIAIKETLERDSSLYLRSKVDVAFLRPFLKDFFDEFLKLVQVR